VNVDMSRSKRYEKEIDYYKTLISILFALSAGLIAWFVQSKEDINLFFQLMSIVLSLTFTCSIIRLHKKVNTLLNKLEDEND
jgi:cobalamin biosynthesis protein CobD/CbiB